MPTPQEIARYDALIEQMSATHQLCLYRACSAVDLTPTKYLGLAALLELADPKMSALASFLQLSPGAATTMVDRMVKHGLAERFNDPSDRRTVYVRATEKGREAFATAKESKMTLVRDAFLRMADGPREQLLTGLEALMNAWNDKGF